MISNYNDFKKNSSSVNFYILRINFHEIDDFNRSKFTNQIPIVFYTIIINFSYSYKSSIIQVESINKFLHQLTYHRSVSVNLDICETATPRTRVHLTIIPKQRINKTLLCPPQNPFIPPIPIAAFFVGADSAQPHSHA